MGGKDEEEVKGKKRKRERKEEKGRSGRGREGGRGAVKRERDPILCDVEGFRNKDPKAKGSYFYAPIQ